MDNEAEVDDRVTYGLLAQELAHAKVGGQFSHTASDWPWQRRPYPEVLHLTMPTHAERLRQVVLKVARAKEHRAELERLMGSFLSKIPYKVAVRRQEGTHKPVYFVESAEGMPDAIPLVAGDVIQNLMSALDHLAYQLVCKDTADNPPNSNWIYFPIADDAAKYDSKKYGKMQGALPDTVAAIDTYKPYRGGNDPLWTLYRLNNIEKHRLLLTVGAQAAGIHLGQLLASHVGPAFGADAVRALESMNLFLNPADKGFPLAPGFELYIGAEDEAPNPKLQFRFMVALNEPGIIEGQPLLELLDELTRLVEDIVSVLGARLA